MSPLGRLVLVVLALVYLSCPSDGQWPQPAAVSWYQPGILMTGYSDPLQQLSSQLKRQDELLQNLQEKVRALETRLERSIREKQTDFSARNQEQRRSTKGTGTSMDLEPLSKHQFNMASRAPVTRGTQQAQKEAQLSSLAQKVASLNSEVLANTVTGEQAAQTSGPEEKATSQNDDLKTPADIRNAVNEIRSKQLTQGLQLEKQASEIHRHTTELQEQKSLLQQEQQKLQGLSKRVDTVDTSLSENTKKLVEFNESIIFGRRNLEDLRALYERKLDLESKLENQVNRLNTKTVNQGSDLTKQAAQLSGLEDKLTSVKSDLEKTTKQLSETSAKKGLQMDEHAKQLRTLEENVTLVTTDLRDKIEPQMNILNETQVTQGTQLSRLEENVTSINDDLEKKTQTVNALNETIAKHGLQLDKQAKQLGTLKKTVTSVNTNLEKRIESQVNNLNDTQLTQGSQLAQQTAQLSRIEENVTLMNDDLEKKTTKLNEMQAKQGSQLAQQAAQLSRIEENVTLIHEDLENKTKHINETQARRVTQEHQLAQQEEQLSSVKENIKKINSDLEKKTKTFYETQAKQGSQLAQQAEQLSRIEENVTLIKDDLGNNTKNLNETQAKQDSQLKHQAAQLNRVENNIKEINDNLKKKTKHLNETRTKQVNQEAQLSQQAKHLNRVEDNIKEIKDDIEEKTKQLNETQIRQVNQDNQLAQQTAQFNTVEEHIQQLKDDLEKKGKDLNETQVKQEKLGAQLKQQENEWKIQQQNQSVQLENLFGIVEPLVIKVDKNAKVINETNSLQANHQTQLGNLPTQLEKQEDRIKKTEKWLQWKADQMQQQLKNHTDTLKAHVTDMDEMEKRIANLAQQKQVAFTVRDDQPSKTMNVGRHAVLKYQIVVTNEGRGYDKDTGVFTAPYDGVYAFFASVRSTNTNGWILLGIYQGKDRLLGYITADGKVRPWNRGGGLVTTRLHTGDEVSVKQTSGSTFLEPGYFTTFSGWLVSAD